MSNKNCHLVISENNSSTQSHIPKIPKRVKIDSKVEFYQEQLECEKMKFIKDHWSVKGSSFFTPVTILNIQFY